MILDAPGGQIGWTTIQRPAKGDVAILVKPAQVLPQTMLWFSNGGRDFPPWNGEHVGVLGIEEACSYGGEGWAASVADNPLTARGIPTALDLGAAASVSVSYAMGATVQDATSRCDIEVDSDAVRFADGQVVPFDRGFIEGR